jgi:hypothetical protein
MMSALGHKQTFAVHQPMSALPPIATAKADMPQMVMSALHLKADMCSAFIDVGLGPEADMLAIATLFDHLVGGHEQSRWQLQSYRLDID